MPEDHQEDTDEPGERRGAGAGGDPADRAGLPVDAGLCGGCRYASVKPTRRNTTYLRCTRAAWDDRLRRYPQLPVTSCAGFAPGEG